MLRKLFSIAFLIIMILAGTGISYMAGDYFIRNNAIDREAAIISGSIPTTSITLSASAFHSLQQERISEQIFEVVINGEHYDIYGTAFNSDGTVTLAAFNDTPENELLIAEREKDASGKNTLQTLPFFFFQFNNTQPSIQLFTTEVALLNIVTEIFPSSPVFGCDSPPPDLYVA